VTGHKFHPSILREYDIRGVVGKTLTEADARALGAAFGTLVAARQGKTVAVGWDGRLSSPSLANAVTAGLQSAGIDVKQVGLGPTPMLYFADRHLNTDGAIMITGSHNPPDYNGFKMVIGHAAVYGETIQRLGEIAHEGQWAAGNGGVAQHPLLATYVERLLKDVDMGRNLSVAWDAGNGATGEALVKLCKDLPGKHILLNERIDGTFPAHHPDPTLPETLEQLRKVVADEGCDIGIAFDGDGDRVGVIDGKGRILWGDQIIVLLAEEVLRKRPGATIIADVKASQVLFDEVARMGGNPLMWRTGHSLIKAKMAETGAPLAGEMSGHIFIADGYYGYDDAIYAAVRLLNVVSRADRSLAALRDRLPSTFSTPEIRFECAEERKFAIVQEVRARLERAKANVNAIDGVRVQTPDGWWLLRASNTQNVLVARCEAASDDGLIRLQNALADMLRDSGIDSAEIDAALGLRPQPASARAVA
jgi:phosphomannomutase